MSKGKQVRKLRFGAVANAIEIVLVLEKVTRSQKREHEYGEDTVVVQSLWKSLAIEKVCIREYFNHFCLSFRLRHFSVPHRVEFWFAPRS
jgi:hypothetical protein